MSSQQHSSNKRGRVNEEQSVQNNKKTKTKDTTTIAVLMTFLCTTMFTLGGAFMMANLFMSMNDFVHRSEIARNRKTYTGRKDWSHYNERISDKMFFRLFRMERACFQKLCTEVEVAVGRDVFKSEQYIKELRCQKHTNPIASMYLCNQSTSGEWVQGELKLALTIRYLAGASYLDLSLAFHVDPNHILRIVRDVKREWLCHEDVQNIDFYRDVLGNEERLGQIKEDFSRGSGGVLDGCIGAIDGWLVPIFCPSRKEVKNPGKYMSRKGFFSINVQVICDKKRRILWSSIGAKGSSHDSSVFKCSDLYKHLMTISDYLYANGLYIVGDSAYALRGFLICPFENAKKGSAEDNFNFFQSSQRIHIECTFGEVHRRFGVFWRPLEGALAEHKYTIESCFRLHNFIVNYREENKNRATSRGVDCGIDDEDAELAIHYEAFYEDNPFLNMGVVGDNESMEIMRSVGRPPADEVLERDRGVALRNILAHRIKLAGIARPS